MTSRTDVTHPNRSAFPAGMSGPSLRALANAGVRSMDDLVGRTEAEISALHGMGPKGLILLRTALESSRRGFRSE